MGARQSKRSVDISAGATKAEKGPAGEPLENGTITTASTDEKQVVEVTGGTEETPKLNGSTPHVDEKETGESILPAKDIKEPANSEEKTEVEVPASEANGDLDVTADESIKSPADESATTEVQASAEKKRKKKKSWSFRSISFSKKDKPKPVVKEQVATDVKSETVQEVAEEETVKEEAKTESEATVEVSKITESPSAVVEVKESVAELNTTNVTEIPPPLPSSPPPVESPAVVPTPTIVETPAPVQPIEPEVTQAEPEVTQVKPEVIQAEPEVTPAEQEDETVGGGEGLAEPPEGLNTSDIEKETEVPLVNGNHVEEDKPEPIQKETSSPDVNYISEKIEAIKIANAADISLETNEVSNNSYEVNGGSDAIAVTNGDSGSD
ncbi:flocculation protein FLO11 [Sipha flava]|uniref:Flocculation protein FLO11 n=1 Tax=Sipha flava TaxID=143950 RepID=A0A8B8GRH0_9HEMI|nr:flocculation protein FLO11 [Sipha flava]